MVIYPDREAAAEAAFVRQESQAFDARARRIRKLGLWAAEHLKLRPQDAENYADSLVQMTAILSSDEDIIGKVELDLANAGIAVSSEDIRRLAGRLKAKHTSRGGDERHSPRQAG